MVRFWHFVEHFDELSVIQLLRTQESTAPSLRYAAQPQRLQSHKFVCGRLLLLPAYTLVLFCDFVAFCCQPACAEAEFYAIYKFDTITDKNLCVL